MKKIMTVDGNEACSYTAYMFTELAGIYPITPSSPMAEHLDEWSSSGVTNIFGDRVNVVEMQSESGAAGFIHGALTSGVLATTFTASQGLLLMIPNMYKMAGEMLPCVIHVASRSIATHALSIFGDHQDIYATRMTGFAILASSSVSDASYLAGIAHLSSIKSSIPFLHFFDGFRTSHEINKIEVLESSDYEELLDKDALKKFKDKALNINKPNTRGTAENDDIYFQNTEVRNMDYKFLPDIVADYMNKINKKANTNYKPFNYYGSKYATKVIVAMGSVCETIKETIDYLNDEIGLIEVHLYRPFSEKYLLDVIPKTVKSIAVLDRTKEFGSSGEPLYLDVVSVLKDKNITIVGGRYGLSSKDTTPSQIKAVYDMLDNPINNFTIGINDDITNLSLEINNDFKINNSREILIYGYGSDGMVSASKSIIKLIGDNTKKFVQGYFQYDSKKSGGVTVSHLRFSNNLIRSTYYVNNPYLVVITKDMYLSSFDTISNIKDNGIVVLNTSMSESEINSYLDINVKKIIKDRNIKLYKINAYELANKLGLKNKISTIMESVIIYLSELIDYDLAKEKIKEYVSNKFFKKGEDIVNSNIKAIDDAINYLKKVNINFSIKKDYEVDNSKNIYELIRRREGDSLPTSAFLNYKSGIFDPFTTRYYNLGLNEIVPSYISSNCIECNQCSLVCPHSVIKSFILDKDEYDLSPDYVKNQCIKALGVKGDYYFTIGIAIKNCTGCGLCINICPGKNDSKALIPSTLSEEVKSLSDKIYDYLDSNIKDKGLFNKNTIKGSQFSCSKFKFHGACAGCGEVNYIKILTQLFGDNLMIANATGCSSIYGGSMPSLPYNIPWANSLFEDNAEFGYGILTGNNFNRNRIKKYMEDNIDNNPLFRKWLENYDNYEITKEVYELIDYNKHPYLEKLKDYIVSRNIWCIGGDGWAYDIGFSGIDHVLSTKDNINILVLDSEIYSNTGGQSSKASRIGSIASFTTKGKKNAKKDLARIAMSYPHVYVGAISFGANFNQTLKVLKEANDYNGPSIVIAYSTCISHGIEGGMINSLEMQKLASNCGYFPLFHYNPMEEKFYLDQKDVDFNLYEDFLMKQTRYKALAKVNNEEARVLLEQNKENSKKRYDYYKSLTEK